MFERILYPTDFGEYAWPNLACFLQSLPTCEEVILVHVVDMEKLQHNLLPGYLAEDEASIRALAEQRFRTDPEVQWILEDLQNKMQAFQRAQQDGTLREEQIQQVREVQAWFYDHPMVREFFEAREAVGLFLQETNRVISEILGLDFGQTVGAAGGVC